MQDQERLICQFGKAQKLTREYRKALQRCTRFREEYLMAEKKHRIANCSDAQLRRLLRLNLLTFTKFDELKDDHKAQQVEQVREWVLSFKPDFWLGNSAKTFSDVKILPSKDQKGQKRGKKALSLEQTKHNMDLKWLAYEQGNTEQKQRLKN